LPLVNTLAHASLPPQTKQSGAVLDEGASLLDRAATRRLLPGDGSDAPPDDGPLQGPPPAPSVAEARSALEGLVDDYAAAYAAMKEEAGVRLRHEARRGDHYEARARQLEGDVREARAELEATRRQLEESRSDACAVRERLAGQAAEAAARAAADADALEAALAALTGSEADRFAERSSAAAMVAELRGRLEAAAAQGVALQQAAHEAEALRVLYGEELARASRMAVDLSRAREAADAAEARNAALATALEEGKGHATRAEDESSALRARAAQLAAALATQGARLEGTSGRWFAGLVCARVC
jgi:chromosome segregation ATPase